SGASCPGSREDYQPGFESRFHVLGLHSAGPCPARRHPLTRTLTMTPAAPAAGAVAPDWIVLKFGGTSVSRRHRWDTIGALMKRRASEEGANVLVVVSAVSGVTNELQAVCDGHADADGTRARIDALVNRHREF